MSEKPREFWVRTKDFDGKPVIGDLDRLCLEYHPENEQAEEFIKVIEYSAYEDLKAKLEVAREALRFYTLKSNYSVVDEGRNYNTDYKCYELNETTYADEELGTKARQALKEIE